MDYEPAGKISQLGYLKERVVEFEKEYGIRLAKLAVIEREIANVGELRLKWFAAVSNVDELDTNSFRKRIEITKKKTEFLLINLSTDLIQLEGFQESLTLQYLVEATKTLGPNESVEARELELQNLLKQNADRWKEELSRSLARRADLCKNCILLGEECDQIRSDFHVQSDHIVRDLHRRMQEYIKHLEAEVEEATIKHRRITGDYLVMRHNAKVGQEILMRHHQDASTVRLQLRDKLDALVAEATEQRAQLARAATAELKIYSDDIRGKVKEKEVQVDTLQRSIHHYNVERKHMRSEMKATTKAYTKKYQELQTKRTDYVRKVESDLKTLRLQVAEMESKLFASNIMEETHDENILNLTPPPPLTKLERTLSAGALRPAHMKKTTNSKVPTVTTHTNRRRSTQTAAMQPSKKDVAMMRDLQQQLQALKQHL